MARGGDLLCCDCSRTFTLMLDLLHRHPDIRATDLARVKDVFEWQSKKIGSPQPPVMNPSAVDQSDVAASLATQSGHKRVQTGLVCEVCGNPLTESDHILCADCSRARVLVLELLRESAPLVQSRLQELPELAADDLNRIGEVFKWRSRKMGLTVSQLQADVAVRG